MKQYFLSRLTIGAQIVRRCIKYRMTIFNNVKLNTLAIRYFLFSYRSIFSFLCPAARLTNVRSSWTIQVRPLYHAARLRGLTADLLSTLLIWNPTENQCLPFWSILVWWGPCYCWLAPIRPIAVEVAWSRIWGARDANRWFCCPYPQPG